ncbi:MAG: sulfur carrier protein ThiS [Gemmatimonadales bacterium]
MIAALPRLHAVTDDRVVGEGRLAERAERLAAVLGAELAVQLRTRTLEGEAFLRLAREVQATLAPHGSWLVVNDRADVASAAGARAVVSGRAGMGVLDLRRATPGLLVGRSVHDAAEARAAAAEGADFLIAGAVYATPSHPGAAPAGLAVVRDAAATGLPVIAIGGMTAERTPEVLKAGASGVAAIRALWDAADPAAAARGFLAALGPRDTLALTVNGEPAEVPPGTTLDALLARLGLDPRAVVVEHNHRIVRREGLAAAALADGDAVEIVHFVGGG